MIDDLVEPSANGTVKYVDDTTVYEVVDRREVSQAQNAINEITQWSEINKFQLHPNKCKELRISFSRSPAICELVSIHETAVIDLVKVLQTAWYQYKQQYKDSYDGAEDKLFRHIDYRQLARRCWGILGKQIRVVLPSCAVIFIGNFYPPLGPEEEIIFKGFCYADE